MRVQLNETPENLRRRVLTVLESTRGTPIAPKGSSAYLGEWACPIYRPDVRGVAYWEFEIAGLRQIQPREHNGQSSGAGFVLASTAEHDIPIPHWSLTLEPPSRALEAKVSGGKVARIIKLDTLAYVAENARGQYLAHLGQFPLQIVTAGDDIMKFRGISTVSAVPRQPSQDDDLPKDLRIISDGLDIPRIELAVWDSWPTAKRGYAKSYEPHLKALAVRAAEAWKIEGLIARFGEGIIEGRSLTVPLLRSGTVQATGDAAGLIKLTMLDRQPPAVEIKALSSKEKKESTFQLIITYQDNSSETLHFFVVPKGTPSNNQSVLPHPIIK